MKNAQTEQQQQEKNGQESSQTNASLMVSEQSSTSQEEIHRLDLNYDHVDKARPEKIELIKGKTVQMFKSEQTEAHAVPGTPFTMIRDKGTWKLLLGKFLVSEEYETMEEAYAQTTLTWDSVTNVAWAIARDVIEDYLKLEHTRKEILEKSKEK